MKKKIYILGVTGMVLVLSLLSLWRKVGESELSLTKNKWEVAVYQEVTLADLLDLNENVLLEDRRVDTTKIGKQEISYQYLDQKGRKKNGKLTLEVVDKEKPYIGLVAVYTHVIGNDFQLQDTVFCGDNYSKKLDCRIIGEYDIQKVGEYPLRYRAQDESGNVALKEFVLKVVEKKASFPSSRISFQTIEERLPENASIMVDVSKWQEDIDWEKVADSGIKYAMLRLGTQIGVGKDSKIDNYFEKNIKEAQANGINVGVYYYSYAKTIEEAIMQADWVIQNLEGYTLQLPVAFDWECWNYFRYFSINFYELNQIADTFLSEMEKAGYEPLLYGSKNYIENVWTYLDYDIWLAHYTDHTTYTKEKRMWQFTNKGEVPGISGGVDVNFYYHL